MTRTHGRNLAGGLETEVVGHCLLACSACIRIICHATCPMMASPIIHQESALQTSLYYSITEVFSRPRLFFSDYSDMRKVSIKSNHDTILHIMYFYWMGINYLKIQQSLSFYPSFFGSVTCLKRSLIFFHFIKNRFFSQTIYPDYSPPSFYSFQFFSTFPPIPSFSVSHQKEQVSKGYSNKIKYNKVK